MSGERDLQRLLSAMEPELRPGSVRLHDGVAPAGWLRAGGHSPRVRTATHDPLAVPLTDVWTQYDALADVYEWLVPEPLLTPEGAAAAFGCVIDDLPRGARVLDCAAGTGQLAVGLALRGFHVVASDISQAMVQRTADLASRHGADVTATTCAWEDLEDQGWDETFDAVFCVGNSLTHAPGGAARRGALASMASLLREDGLLVLTSRNWEQVRAGGSRLEIADGLVRREAGEALTVHAWTIPTGWDDRHTLEVAVALLDGAGGVTTHGARLSFWPFTPEQLDEDLRAVGLVPASSTYDPSVERYLVTARGPAAAGP